MRETRSIAQRIAVAIICIAVLSYTVFHMISLFDEELTTVVVRSATEETVIEFEGHIFRDEELVRSSYGGAVDYIAKNGVRLGIGDEIAVVYEQGSNAGGTIEAIDEKIAILEESRGSDVTLSALPSINDEAVKDYTSIIKKLASGDARGISSDIDAMTAELAKVSVLTNESSPVPETLKKLYETREQMSTAGGNTERIISNKTGYFYADVDGYEGKFTYDAADGLTCEKYSKLTTSDPVSSNAGGYAIGKTTESAEWRFVTVLEEKDATYFKEGEVYQIDFNGGGEMKIPLTLQRISQEGAQFLLVFNCDRVPAGFDFTRSQSVSVAVQSVTGISVPKTAVHKSGGEFYVYILRGSVVLERKIEVIYETRDYYTVRDGVEDDGEHVYLQSNDNLILNGKNLFDGRIVD